MIKDVMCIKVMKATEPLVLKYNLYYSDVKPDDKKYINVSTIFLIGEAINGSIPLIGTCDVIINECMTVHPDFVGYAKGSSGWKYEWKLQNFNKASVPDIRAYISSSLGNKDKDLITNLQKIVYIESNNLVIPKIGASISIGNNNLTSNPTVKTTNKVATVKKKIFKNTYQIGDVVQLRNGLSKGYYEGIVVNIEDLIEDGILYDQKLTIKNKINDTKIYSASTLRSLEEKTATPNKIFNA